MSSEYNIKIDQRTDFSFVLQFLDGNVARDLTGATAAGQIREKPGGVALADFQVAIDIPAGEMTFSLSEQQTAALPIKKLYYDILIRHNGRKKVIHGRADVKWTVTE